METWSVVAQAVVVLGAIVLGVRMGGIGLGLWGVVGTGVLVFGFSLPPGSAPVDAFFIIIAVVTASAAMQAAGGIDYLVSLASRIIRRNPRRLTYVAPLVAFAFTVFAGTGNIFFALIPVIYSTALANGQRPERALAASTVASGLGITASPVSAAMAAYLVLVSPEGFDLPRILAITLPAALIACVAMSFVQQRLGKELLDDPEFVARVAAGKVALPASLAEKAASVPELAGVASDGAARPGSATSADSGSGGATRLGRGSALIFGIAIVIVVALGLFPELRPSFPADDGVERLSMTAVIEIVMFAAALAIMLICRVKPDAVTRQPLLKSGGVAAIALFGIAWLADTFIEANQATVIEPLGALIDSHPLLLAVALFLVAGLTTSQSATTNTIVPIAIGAAMAPGLITAMWPSLIGIWLFPANGSQIAAVSTDETGSTRLSSVPIWHSFTVPMLVSWVVVVAAGLAIQTFA